MDGLWRAVIRQAARRVPEGEPIRLRVDETVCKKSGEKIEPADTYRNGAGTARQEYRTLWGICFAEGEMRMRLPGWPEDFVSVPIGLEVYLKKEKAEELGQKYVRRSRLGQRLVKRVAEEVGPDRRVLSVQDGNYATQYFLQGLPENVGVVGRMPKNAALYERPGPQPESKPGPDPEKGDEIGSPEEVAEEKLAEEKLAEEKLAEGKPEWHKHPTEEDAQVCSFEAIWQSVLPGQVLRVVLLRRPHLKDADSAKKRKRYLEVFFTTDLRLGPEQILREYRGRWSIEILIREAKESFGLGKDRCRNTQKISGTDNFRLLIGAAEVLYIAETQEVEKQKDDVQESPDEQEPPDEFDWLRPWYEDPGGPNLFDVHWGIREELANAGITPKVRLRATLGEFDQNGASVQPRAA
jgi:Archaeal putative transposase ISC1217.